MYRLLVVIIFATLSAQAQFSGLSSFFADTNLRALMKANRVSSVTEFAEEDSTIYFNGRYHVDTSGLVMEVVLGRGPYYTRKKFAYTPMKMVTKEWVYDNTDTSKVESWSIRTWDKKNRMIKYERGRMQDGKPLVNTEFETVYTREKPGAMQMESKRYDGKRLRSITKIHDSISRQDTFLVGYEYRMEEGSGKKVLTGKTISRSYTKENCFYEDAVTYNVYGKTETAQKVKTSYYKRDKAGRWTDYGEINYDDAYEDFVQEHPEDFNPNYYSPLFIKAFLEGRIQGVRKPEAEYTFTAGGLLMQENSQGYRQTFTYNANNQLTEQLTYKEQELVSTLIIRYNQKGLISHTTNTYTLEREEGEPEKISEKRNYTYTFY